MRAKVIIFFGPDGSGKTTQADLLVQELLNNGLKTRKIWLRSLHTLSYLISKVAMRVLKLDDVYEFRTKFQHSRFFKTTWIFIEFISILPLIATKFYLPLLGQNIVVAERFVIDWIVSLAFVMQDESITNSYFKKLAFKFLPTDSILLYIDANYEAILARRGNEDTLEFIEFQRKLYSKFASELNAIMIDTSDKTIEQVHNLVLQQLQMTFNTRLKSKNPI